MINPFFKNNGPLKLSELLKPTVGFPNLVNDIPNNDKLKNKFNCNNNNSCNPPDFSKANIVNCKSHITIQNKETDKLENYCPQTFKDFNYGNIKSCDLTNNNTTISYNNINCIGSDIYC